MHKDTIKITESKRFKKPISTPTSIIYKKGEAFHIDLHTTDGKYINYEIEFDLDKLKWFGNADKALWQIAWANLVNKLVEENLLLLQE